MKITFKYKEYHNFDKYGKPNANKCVIKKRFEIFEGSNLIKLNGGN